MKKEIFACVLLAAILGLTIFNYSHISQISSELTGTTDEIIGAAEENNWGQALALTEKVMAKWADNAGFIHVTMKHDEINEITNEFFELKLAVRAGKAADTVTLCEKIQSRLQSVCDLEKIRVGSIF